MPTDIRLGGTTENTTTTYTAQTTVVIAPSAVAESQNKNEQFSDITLTLAAPSATETLGLTAAGTKIAADEQVTASYDTNTGALNLKSDSTETAAVWTSLLQTVTYTNTSPTPSATETINVTATYTQGKNTKTETAVDTLTLAAENATPTVTTGGTLKGTEDTTLTLSGVTIADADAGSTKLTTTLTAASGTLSGSSTATVTVTGSTTAVLTLNGTVTNLNAYIAGGGVTYTGAPDANGATTIGISVTDDGTTGTGGPKTGTGTLNLTLAAVNDAPTVSINSAPNLSSASANKLTGITFADVDAGAASVTAKLGVTSGFLAATSGSGVTVTMVGNELALSGSIADINNFIAAGKVGYSALTTGSMVLTASINDGGNTGSGGALSATSKVALNLVDDSSPEPPAPFEPLPTPRPNPSAAGLTADLAFGNIVGVDVASPKAANPSVLLPDGRLVENVLHTEAQKTFALQNDLAAGRITQRQYQDAIIEFAHDTTGLAVQEFQFFTGKTPTRDALDFAVNSTANTRDLTDALYAGLSQVERYITFAVDLVKDTTATASFQSAYSGLTFEAAVRQAISTIIGPAAGFNVEATVSQVLGQQAYLQSFGGGDIGAKAAMVGYIMDLGMRTHVGAYQNAAHNFMADLYDGQALFAVSLVGVYATPVVTT